jgi:hypothetical protein
MNNPLSIIDDLVREDIEFEYLERQPEALWVFSENYSLSLGFDHEWVYLEKTTNAKSEHSYWAGNRHNIGIRFKPCEYSRKLLAGKIPSWIDLPFAFDVIHATHDEMVKMAPGKTGRFMVGNEIVTTERDAIWCVNVFQTPIDKIEYTPDVKLILNCRKNGHSLQIWDDGCITKPWMHPNCEAEIKTTEDITLALLASVGKPEWTRDDRWKKLLTLDVLNKKKIFDCETGTPGNSRGATIENWQTNIGDLFLLHFSWGSLGEDGDAGDNYYLYEKLASAKEKAIKLLS